MNIQVAQRDEPVESAPDALSLPEASKSDDLRADEEYQCTFYNIQIYSAICEHLLRSFG